MFQDFSYIKGTVRIKDSEFIADADSSYLIKHDVAPYPVIVLVADAVIRIYSQRGLNVAYNLVLMLKRIDERWVDVARSQMNMRYAIEVLKEQLPSFVQYEEEIEKYLVLL